MDECMLNDLLECSVCLERLDTSSKVLPCQHTFCKKCLEDIVESNKELRCPECRVLIECKIDELPPNVLLMRILEGMRNAAPKKQQVRATGPVRTHAPMHQPPSADRNVPKQQAQPGHFYQPHQPYARAVYDYISKEQGDLSFKKGDIILLRKRVDTHWYHGECSGKQGVFPLTYVQIMTPMLSHSPQCKALYDFRMTNDDEEGCLTFNKGEVISVIRRVDENWAEGKLDDRIGIFPLAFVELNSLARSLMKLSTNSQPGPSRVAPPTPTTEDSTPLIPTDHTQNISPQSAPQQKPQTAPPQQTNPSNALLPTSDSSSTVSSAASSATTTPNTSSSNTSSSSSTAPSSPASPPPAKAQRSKSGGHREKRHSFSAGVNTLQGQQHHQPQENLHRRSAEIHLSPEETIRRQDGAAVFMGVLPAAYIALYPYKPQKSDELELRKGGIYMVTERCQDGWFKGTSNRTQKTGVFPGNYVTPARTLPRQVQQHASPLDPGKLQQQTYRSSKSNNSNAVQSPALGGLGARLTSVQLQPPELPPRASSPAASSVSASWHGQPEHMAAAPLGRSQSAVMTTGGSAAAVAATGKTPDKTKERKEKSTVSLMRRLTSIKKPKSPPPSSYSMDNPVFEDSSVPSTANIASTHSVHVRSGSCPSQLLQVQPLEGAPSPHHRLFAATGSSSQRLKHKERPNVILANLAYNTRNQESNPAATQQQYHHHRKSNSLDAGTRPNANNKPVSQQASVPERYRCIVPYPPNTEYELELQVNDIIYVHKKREDGWYKGMLQRTGRTGLFPASFVENY